MTDNYSILIQSHIDWIETNEPRKHVLQYFKDIDGNLIRLRTLMCKFIEERASDDEAEGFWTEFNWNWQNIFQTIHESLQQEIAAYYCTQYQILKHAVKNIVV